jgi:hypothetical protein
MKNAMPIYCDNDIAQHLAEDHVWHSHTKHICVKFHSIRWEIEEEQILSVPGICSADNLADILTKPLRHTAFKHLQNYLSLHPMAVH